MRAGPAYPNQDHHPRLPSTPRAVRDGKGAADDREHRGGGGGAPRELAAQKERRGKIAAPEINRELENEMANGVTKPEVVEVFEAVDLEDDVGADLDAGTSLEDCLLDDDEALPSGYGEEFLDDIPIIKGNPCRNKPGVFIRAHPTWNKGALLIELEVDGKSEFYAVPKTMLGVEPMLVPHVKPYTIHVIMDNQGEPWAWVIRRPADDEPDNAWWVSARKALGHAQAQWVHTTTVRSKNGYKVVSAASQALVAKWPDLYRGDPGAAEADKDRERMRAVFELILPPERRVTSPDHFVIKKLKGM